MNCKWIRAILIQTKYEVEEKQSCYKVWDCSLNYWVSYCVKYRPAWMDEWILARWWWNDAGIWTPDWIFNDWII